MSAALSDDSEFAELSAFRRDDVDCAREAGVVRANDPDEFERVIRVFDLGADQRLFASAVLALVVFRRAVPRCRNNRLIVVRDVVLYLDPVADSAARGVGEAHSAGLVGDRRIVERRFARFQRIQPYLHVIQNQDCFESARRMAAGDRAEVRRFQLQAR